MQSGNDTPVTAVREKLVIPTYRSPEPESYPMFAENRVHQRTSGRPYPNKVVLKVDRQGTIDKEYDIIRLENEYLRLRIIPELAGRIYSATDKTTGYEFLYRNPVIKPALIGALGSWISGGMEFNWPYHHRPSAFMPVDSLIEEEADGSATVWLSEHEPIERTKGMVGIRLRPREAIFETRMRLANRTNQRRSFLWFENAGVPINKDYEIIFPPDVTYVNFHYHRSVTTWPKASGVYNGIRMGDDLEINMHGNTLCPTSYFSAASKYDFFGGYDHGKQCGVIHVSNHHTSTGKKLFTWAYNQLSEAWTRAMTDTSEDNPGINAELMAGSYSDNQPDFSWIEPYETKKFSQFWYPVSAIGAPQCANTNLALRLEKTSTATLLKLYPVRSISGARITITAAGGRLLLDSLTDLPAGKPMELAADPVTCPVTITITAPDGQRLIEYSDNPNKAEAIPEPWDDLPGPLAFTTAQELHLVGVHVEQYKDPRVMPDSYWERAIQVDPDYVPALVDLGLYRYRQGDYAKALVHLEKARGVATRHNGNPRSGEVFHVLGLVHLALGDLDSAYAAFYKGTWNEAFVSRGMTHLAAIDGRRGDFWKMREHAGRALEMNADNCLAGPLEAAAELRLGNLQQAAQLLEKVLKADPLNHLAGYLKTIAEGRPVAEFLDRLSSSPSQTCLDLAYDLIGAGLVPEAKALLTALPDDAAPLVWYTLGVLSLREGDLKAADKFFQKGELAPEGKTFAWRLEELAMLEEATRHNPGLAKAQYALGNLLYDKRRYAEAEACWLMAAREDAHSPGVHRNLAVARFSHLGRRDEALQSLRTALSLAPGDGQLVYETGYVMAKLGVDADERVRFFAEHATEKPLREDIAIEWAKALIQAGQPDKALEVMTGMQFVPPEGGEHGTVEPYMMAHHFIGRKACLAGDFAAALRSFRSAQVLPDSLGAGLWHEALLVPHQYHEADCLMALGRADEAARICEHIISLTIEYFANMRLPELPVYQARALQMLGRNAAAEKQLRDALRNWMTRLNEDDAGFFKSTPFFISYMDLPAEARKAHFRYLTGLARLALGDHSGAERDFDESLAADPSQLAAWVEREVLARSFNPVAEFPG